MYQAKSKELNAMSISLLINLSLLIVDRGAFWQEQLYQNFSVKATSTSVSSYSIELSLIYKKSQINPLLF